MKKLLAILLAAAAVMGLAGCAPAPKTPASEPQTAASPSTPQTPATAPGFTMDFLSTGKSDCVIIRMDGLVMVNDTADSDDFSAICAALDSYGISRIDYLILSHMDKDHIGSAGALIGKYEVGLVLMPQQEEASDEYAALTAAISATGVKVERLTSDYSFAGANGSVHVYAPEKAQYDDDNNYSLITAVRYGDHGFLLTGDALKKRISEFNGVCQDAWTLVKLPHHGSYNQALDTLLSNAGAAYAVEMVSPDEQIDPELIAKLSETGTKLFLTCDGAVHVSVSNGKMDISAG